MRSPRFGGFSLVNLIAELEYRLTGTCQAPRLDPSLATLIPEAETYVLALFDGLGAHQLDHPRAGALLESQAGTIDSMFPSTTTVSLATVATGRTPLEHGIISYMMYFPEHGVVNMLKWTKPRGAAITADTVDLLPSPNLWERLRIAGVEPICVQPGAFERTPLTRALYRGARYESAWNENDIVDATSQLAAEPGRLIFTYIPHVDVAAHVAGQQSADYADAIGVADHIWQSISDRLPHGAVMVGTADHGHVDYTDEKKVNLPPGPHTIYGEPRAIYVKTSAHEGTLAPPDLRDVPATWIPGATVREWFGPGTPHPDLESRIPDGALMPDPGYLLFTDFMDRRLVGMHGGLEAPELEIPLLVSPRPASL